MRGAPAVGVTCTEVRRPVLVVTVTGAFSATPDVLFEGLMVTAAASWADKSAADVLAWEAALCDRAQAESATAARTVAAAIVAACFTFQLYGAARRSSPRSAALLVLLSAPSTFQGGIQGASDTGLWSHLAVA
jgi:hypothetical protein